MRLLIAILGVVFVFLGSPAYAVSCSSPINDGAQAITDKGKVANAISAAGNHGATIKVVTFDSVPAKSLKLALLDAAKSCPEWQNTRHTALANNLIIVGYGLHAPDNTSKQTIGMVYGADEAPYLGTGKENNLLGRLFVPSVQEYQQGKGNKDAITNGMVSLIDGIGGVLSQPVLGGNVVSIHKDATSYTGLWVAFILIVIGLIAYFAWKSFSSAREESDDRSGYQADARRVRSELVSGLNGLSDDETYLDAKSSNDPALRELFDQYKNLARAGLRAFAEFDNLGGADPNAVRLSERAYQANQSRYEGIIRDFVNPAKELARQIRAGKADPAPSPRSEPTQSPQWNRSAGEQTTAWRRSEPTEPTYRTQPSEPTPPSRPSQPDYNPQPNYGQPYQPPYQPVPQGSSGGGFLESAAGGFAGSVLADSILHGHRDDGGYERGRADEARHEDYQRQQDSIDDARSDAQDDHHVDAAPSDDDGSSFDVDSSPSATDNGSSFDVGSTDSGSGFDSGSSSDI